VELVGRFFILGFFIFSRPFEKKNELTISKVQPLTTYRESLEFLKLCCKKLKMIKRCGEKRPACPDSGAGWPIS
jgi:hypothetical protein